jgi:chemotaxis protein CheZ
MAEPLPREDDRIELARSLIVEIEAGNEAEVGRLIMGISRLQEDSLFTEIGKLTRQLHDSLRSVELDGRLADITVNEIPDAKERLNYVIQRTEDAANRTLTAVEEALPMVSDLSTRTSEFSAEWSRFRRREMSVEEFRKLSENVDGYLESTGNYSHEIHRHLNDVLMAQDFQDLTGQVIKKVIDLVHQVEVGLVDMIKLSGNQVREEEVKVKGTGTKVEGPQIGAQDNQNVVNGQDDVDDLLSSLGF